MRTTVVLVVACVASLLGGCGGGHSAPPLAPSSPATGSSTSGGISTTASFRLTIPARTSAAALRSPKYLSSSTQSVIITVVSVNGTPYTGSAAATATNLSPANPNCSGAPLTCTISVPAPPGSDVFSVATYDAPQTSSTPAGNLLSQANLSTVVLPNVANVVTALTLAGVASTFGVVATGPVAPPNGTIAARNYLQGTVAGLTLWGPQAQTLTVTPYDADGNAIVGVGAPALSMTSGSPTLSVSAASNVFTLQATTSGSPPVVTPGNVHLTLTATASDPSVAPVVTVVPLTIAHSILYVSNYGTSVYVFLDGNTTASQTLSSFANANGIAVDTSGNVWIADGSTSTIQEFAPGGSTPLFTITAGVSDPNTIRFDANGTLFVANGSGPTITSYLANSAVVHSTITASLSEPSGVAVTRSGTVYVADFSAGNIFTFANGANVVSTVRPLLYAQDVVLDAAGTVYGVPAYGGAVNEYFNGSLTAGRSITGLNNAAGLAVDAAGTLYVTDFGNSQIDEYPADPSGVGSVTTPTVTVAASAANFITVVPASPLAP